VIDILCKCGHDWGWHDRSDYGFKPEEESWCINYECECLKYKPDNLLTIERIAEKKGLV
jgi:hypothetical protein